MEINVKNFKIILIFCFFSLNLMSCDDESINSPDFTSTPTLTANEFAPYSYNFSCIDPANATLEVIIGENDSCEGELIYLGGGAGFYNFTPAENSGDSTCFIELICKNSSKSIIQNENIQIFPPLDISLQNFSGFSTWNSPIEDFITINSSELGHSNFRSSISELAVYEDNLYIGYGDADLNLGRITQIEVRYFSSLNSTAYNTDFATDEEEISLYRKMGDYFVIPGVDATEDNLIGNVYSLSPGGSWYKSRTLEFAWHVHDANILDNNIYAVGSGGTIDDYNNSTVNAFLWKSEDNGVTFQIQEQLPHPNPPGDHRLTQLLKVSDTLYSFGYYSSNGVSSGIAYTFDGSDFTEYSEMPPFYVLNTWQLNENSGLIRGVNIGTNLTFGVMYVDSQGIVPITSLNEITCYDIFPLDNERALILYRDGNVYPVPEFSVNNFNIGLLDENKNLTILLNHNFEFKPVSIAYWKHHIFVGLENGEVVISTFQ
jgi:hypothetical protein